MPEETQAQGVTPPAQPLRQIGEQASMPLADAAALMRAADQSQAR